MSELIDSVLERAADDAETASVELNRRASVAVDGLQVHVARDGGRKVLTAGARLMPLLAEFGAACSLSPGELALILAASMHNVLMSLPELTPELARAIAIELASGPRSV